VSERNHNIKSDNDFKREEPLSKRVVRGGIWVFALRITNRGLGFIRTIILARLLVVHDFGLLGIAMLAIATLETFSQTGFQAALIQKKENVESYLDTAWTVSAVRGIILSLILFLSAPVIAKFFNSPQATLVIMVIAVSTLLSGFRNIGILFFQKELEFNKQFFYELSATLVDLTVAITLAFMLRNVWALVWGGLAGNFMRLLMSYVLHSYRPRIRFEKEKFQGLFGFGKWVLGSSILIFLIMQGDDIFVGKLLGVTALGFYQMAYMISNLPATEITHVISQVTFPAYSKLQDDISKLREAYLKVLQITGFISIPLAGGIFVLAPEFTQIFLGEKWLPMVPAMQVLAIFGLIRALAATTGCLFQGSGNPHILTKLAILQLGILVGIIYPLTARWGILGTSVAVVISNFITQGVTTFKIVKLTEAKALDVLKLVAAPTVTTTVMVLCLWFIQTLFSSSIIVFLGLIVSGTLVYLVIMYIIDRKFGLNYRAIFGQLQMDL
jgi:O-antigen/teichoic acid export membrane protein